MSEWISVKERLPEKEGYYLVYFALPRKFQPLIVMRYFRKEFPGSFVFRKEMTHWMPLPSPPGEEGE